MEIAFSGQQVDVSDRLRAHVESALQGSVTKYFASPLGCSVSFTKSGEEFDAEIIARPARDIVLKGVGAGADPYSAFDAANAHIATRLRRYKNKITDHGGRPSMSEIASEAVFPFDESEEELSTDFSAPLTIAETGATVPVCSVSEAVMLMDFAHQPAILFRNASNSRISMVYRRGDGNIGWVEPKGEKGDK